MPAYPNHQDIRPAYVQETDPGAVGAGIFWFKASTLALSVRNLTDTAWDTISSGSTVRRAIFPTPSFEEPEELVSLPPRKGDPGTPGATGSTGRTGRQIPPLEQEELDPPAIIPGRRGAPGVGTPGTKGQRIPPLEQEEPDPPQIIPGRRGLPGAAGISGTKGLRIPPIEQEELDPPPIIPGRRGVPGATGATGLKGQRIPPLEVEEPELPFIIPGRRGLQGKPGKTVIIPLYIEESDAPVVVPGKKGVKGDTGAAGGGGGTATIVERNLGSTANWQGKFTVTDAAVSATSKVLIWQSYGPYTGKGTRADEAEMDRITCYAEPGAGQMIVKWRSVESYVRQDLGPTPYNQFVPVAASRDIVTQPMFAGLAVRGKVKGNVKFTYQVF